MRNRLLSGLSCKYDVLASVRCKDCDDLVAAVCDVGVGRLIPWMWRTGGSVMNWWLLFVWRVGAGWSTVMWFETVGLSTRPVSEQKIGLGLSLAGLMSCCETRSWHPRPHNDLEGHSNFSSTINTFSILCLTHHFCGDQKWRSLT